MYCTGNENELINDLDHYLTSRKNASRDTSIEKLIHPISSSNTNSNKRVVKYVRGAIRKPNDQEEHGVLEKIMENSESVKRIRNE